MKLGLYSAWLLSGLFAGSRSPRLSAARFLRSAKAAGSEAMRDTTLGSPGNRHVRAIRRLDYRHHGVQGAAGWVRKNSSEEALSHCGFPPQLPGPLQYAEVVEKVLQPRQTVVSQSSARAGAKSRGESVPASRPTTCSRTSARWDRLASQVQGFNARVRL